MVAPQAGARPSIVAPRLANIKHGRNLGGMCAICQPGGGPEDSVLSGWMVTLVNEPAGAAALPPPACSARELVGRASAEGSSARGRKPKVGPWRVRGWLRTSRVGSGGASVDADTFWPPRPAATEAAAGCMPSLQDCSWPRRVCAADALQRAHAKLLTSTSSGFSSPPMPEGPPHAGHQRDSGRTRAHTAH